MQVTNSFSLDKKGQRLSGRQGTVGREKRVPNTLRRLAGSRNKKAWDRCKCRIPQNTHQKVLCRSKRAHLKVETSTMGSDAWERAPGWEKGARHSLRRLIGSRRRSQMTLVSFEHLRIIIKRHSASQTVHTWKLETLDGR